MFTILLWAVKTLSVQVLLQSIVIMRQRNEKKLVYPEA